MPRYRNPTDYRGPNVNTTARIVRDRAPTEADYRRPETNNLYELGSEWVDNPNKEIWFLVDITANVATWVKAISGSGDLVSLTGDDSDVVVPDGTGNIDVFGKTVANATRTKPVWTEGTIASNLLEVEVQVSTAVTPSPADKNDAGIASFNENQFTVTEHGMVSVIGDPDKPVIQTITGDDQEAVGPDANGNIDWQGSAVANGTNGQPLFMNGTPASNLMEPEIQVACDRTGAPGDKNDAGVASFNDVHFVVDADGYVSGVGDPDKPYIQTITGDDAEAVGPDGDGNIDWTGLAVANATFSKPLYFNGTPGSNHMYPSLQVTTALSSAPSDKDDAGVSSFSSNDFSVTEHGYVALTNPPARKFSLYEDFITGPTIYTGVVDPYMHCWKFFPTTADVRINVDRYESGHPGIVRLVSNTGYASIGSGYLAAAMAYEAPSITIGSGEVYITSWARLNAGSLAEAGDYAIFGFMQVAPNESPSQYAWFRADYGNTYWTAQNYDGTQTATTTSVTIDANWHYFEITINADGSSIEYKIDGSVEATHTTHLPEDGTSMGWAYYNQNSNDLYIDTMTLDITLTGDRATTG